LTSDQLQAARATHWRQKQNPLLTLDEARDWLAAHGLCLYLPRRTQLPAPAPSLVEACLGTSQATSDAAAIGQAHAMMARLTASRSVVALNLLGTVSEQPDFLVHIEALPYVVCLRADSDWQQPPRTSAGHKGSPLAAELWKVLDQAGGMTAAQARETLGRELSESAVLRALSELWQGLRISPVWAETNQPPRWEPLRLDHRDAFLLAKSTSQVTALSLLVSLYLASVYAATGEEIEIFLSPLASRSRVREAVRGLSATRQVLSLSMEAHTFFFLEGGLPDLGEAAPPAAPELIVAQSPPASRPAHHPRPARTGGPVADAPPSQRPRPRPGRPAVPPPSDRKGVRPAAGWVNANRPPAPRPTGGPTPRMPFKKAGDEATGGKRFASGSGRPFDRRHPRGARPSGEWPRSNERPRRDERPRGEERPGERPQRQGAPPGKRAGGRAEPGERRIASSGPRSGPGSGRRPAGFPPRSPGKTRRDGGSPPSGSRPPQFRTGREGKARQPERPKGFETGPVSARRGPSFGGPNARGRGARGENPRSGPPQGGRRGPGEEFRKSAGAGGPAWKDRRPRPLPNPPGPRRPPSGGPPREPWRSKPAGERAPGRAPFRPGKSKFPPAKSRARKPSANQRPAKYRGPRPPRREPGPEKEP
jgi:23S rRNA pseudouridine2605 synthase